MTAGAAPLRGVWLAALYALAIALLLSPLLWVSVPPLVDYPTHLARAWVLADGGRTPELAANYTIAWRVVPYLGMDAIVVGLSALMPVEMAGRVFVALTIVSLLGGTAALHRVLYGRAGAWPLACLLCVYNHLMYFGFVVCLFTMGLAMLGFAGWIAARQRPVWWRVAVFAPVAVALLLGHLFAFGVYGLLVGGYELGLLLAGGRVSWRGLLRAAALGLQFVPALALFAATAEPTGMTLTGYGDIFAKLVALFAPFTFGLLPSGLDWAVWLFGMAALYWGFARGGVRIARPMRLPLLAVLLATVAMPEWLSGVWGADKRLPVVLPFLLIACSAPVAARPPRALQVAAAVLVLVRVWSVSVAFADYDAWYGEFRAAARVIAPGARLLAVAPDAFDPPLPLPGLPAALGEADIKQFRHLPAVALIDRSVFYSYFFGGWFTVQIAPRQAAIAQAVGGPITPAQLWQSATPGAAPLLDPTTRALHEAPYWRNWPADFDYALWLSSAPGSEPVPANLQPVAQGHYFTLYRIQH